MKNRLSISIRNFFKESTPKSYFLFVLILLVGSSYLSGCAPVAPEDQKMRVSPKTTNEEVLFDSHNKVYHPRKVKQPPQKEDEPVTEVNMVTKPLPPEQSTNADGASISISVDGSDTITPATKGN